MIDKFKIAPLTRIFISIYFIILILNYVGNGFLFSLLSLNSQQVIHHLEIWRLLTFVLAPENIESTFLLSFVFWFIGPKLESGFNRSKFMLFMLLTAILQGTVFTFLLIRSNNFISGGEGLALTLLSLYVFLELTTNNGRISLGKFVSLPTSILVTILWLSAVIIHNSFSGKDELSISVISGAFGALIGTIVFMQIRLMDYLTGRKRNIRRTYSVPKHEELIETISTRREMMKKMAFHEEEEYSEDENSGDYYSEEHLNRILDKISSFGKDSLTDEEKLYLREYSEKL